MTRIEPFVILSEGRGFTKTKYEKMSVLGYPRY